MDSPRLETPMEFVSEAPQQRLVRMESPTPVPSRSDGALIFDAPTRRYAKVLSCGVAPICIPVSPRAVSPRTRLASPRMAKKVSFGEALQDCHDITPAARTYGENPAFFNFDQSGAHLHYIDGSTGACVRAPYKDWSLPSPPDMSLSPLGNASLQCRSYAGNTPHASISRPVASPMAYRAMAPRVDVQNAFSGPSFCLPTSPSFLTVPQSPRQVATGNTTHTTLQPPAYFDAQYPTSPTLLRSPSSVLAAPLARNLGATSFATTPGPTLGMTGLLPISIAPTLSMIGMSTSATMLPASPHFTSASCLRTLSSQNLAQVSYSGRH